MIKKVIKYFRKLKPGQYFEEVRKKRSIFLHHTVSSTVAAAVDWWDQTAERVATAILIGRDGAIWQCFEINQWAYHLGVTKGTGITTRESVGIEIVAWGFLFKEGNEFVAYPLFPNKSTRVVIPKDDVITLDTPFRGSKYWHKYTDEQVEAIVWTCRYLVDRFDIKVQKDLTNICDFDFSVIEKDKPGIWTHSTVRKDKSDIFPQPNLIAALQKEFNKAA